MIPGCHIPFFSDDIAKSTISQKFLGCIDQEISIITIEVVKKYCSTDD